MRAAVPPLVLALGLVATPGDGRAGVPEGDAPPVVAKVEPPSWWPAHSINPVRLLVRGSHLRGARVMALRDGTEPDAVTVNPGGTSLFVSVRIDSGAEAGDYPFALHTEAGEARIPFRLNPPLDPSRGPRGITPDDIIYLIMPDRFSDGDPTRNAPADAPPRANDRNAPRGFHGGDFRGILHHLPYLKQLGVTALWLNPWYDNWNGLQECGQPWCPYTYYHGYHPIDFYAVEDRFGSLDDLRELVAAAHRDGLKVIQDQISNHVGARHPWVGDPPLPTWFHGTPETHDVNPFRVELLVSPHASELARRPTLNGWFADDLPDLNQDEPELSRYLIQNALWWVGMTGIDGIREDTLPYLPRSYIRELTRALHRQYPRLWVVGEVLQIDPALTSFFLGGRPGWDGIDTGLDSVFDFPLWAVSTNVFTGKMPASALRTVLAADALYPDAARLTTLTGNHDLPRFLSAPQATPEGAMLHTALTLSMRGTPQLYYGDEIAMAGGDDPDNRRDFPGGFPGDPRNAFEERGRTELQQRMFEFTRSWIRLRREHSAIRRGDLVELAYDPDAPAFARRDDRETVVIAINRAVEPRKLIVPGAAMGAGDGSRLAPLLGADGSFEVRSGTVGLTVPPRTATAFVVVPARSGAAVKAPGPGRSTAR